MMVKGNSQFKLTKIYANKIACGLISEGIYKALQVEVVPKKKLPMTSLMIRTSALVLIMMIASTKQFFMKLLR
jgi:hypothetical protein